MRAINDVTAHAARAARAAAPAAVNQAWRQWLGGLGRQAAAGHWRRKQSRLGVYPPVTLSSRKIRCRKAHQLDRNAAGVFPMVTAAPISGHRSVAIVQSDTGGGVGQRRVSVKERLRWRPRRASLKALRVRCGSVRCCRPRVVCAASRTQDAGEARGCDRRLEAPPKPAAASGCSRLGRPWASKDSHRSLRTASCPDLVFRYDRTSSGHPVRPPGGEFSAPIVSRQARRSTHAPSSRLSSPRSPGPYSVHHRLSCGYGSRLALAIARRRRAWTRLRLAWPERQRREPR
jgi:hypothetical protein